MSLPRFLLVLLAALLVASSSAQEVDQMPWHEWLNFHNAFIETDVTTDATRPLQGLNDSPLFLSFKASAPLEKGTVLLTVGRHAAITAKSIDELEQLRVIFERDDIEEYFDTLDAKEVEHIKLRLLLLYQNRRMALKATTQAPLLRAIPHIRHESPVKMRGSPSYWSDAELENLQDSSFASAVLARRFELEQQYEHLFLDLFEENANFGGYRFTSSSFPFTSYVWADAVLRAFSYEDSDGERFLSPFLDLFTLPEDYVGESNCVVTFDGKSVIVEASKDIAEGEAIHCGIPDNSSNSELLFNHGVVAPNNPNHFVALKIIHPMTRKNIYVKDSLFRKTNQASFEDIYPELSKTPFFGKDHVFAITDFDVVPDALLKYWRVESHTGTFSPALVEATNNLQPLAPKEEVKALKLLKHELARLLRRYETTVEEDEAILAADPPLRPTGLLSRENIANYNLHSAVVLRREEKQAIIGLMAATQKLIDAVPVGQEEL
eukprot:TRINITY_DN3057_c0_g1_i1.p1 TRINITY_DN3057_c0_g1~~TRINITY_DN3057_c0_g1_i1.p1  ORF type:complete len:499 (+),score=128.65 TRINITY_DN3057_c0_g1_i1:24-1499(+)